MPKLSGIFVAAIASVSASTWAGPPPRVPLSGIGAPFVLVRSMTGGGMGGMAGGGMGGMTGGGMSGTAGGGMGGMAGGGMSGIDQERHGPRITADQLSGQSDDAAAPARPCIGSHTTASVPAPSGSSRGTPSCTHPNGYQGTTR